MMTNMYDRGLLDTGEYVVIYFDHETVDTIDPLKYYRRKYSLFYYSRQFCHCTRDKTGMNGVILYVECKEV